MDEDVSNLIFSKATTRCYLLCMLVRLGEEGLFSGRKLQAEATLNTGSGLPVCVASFVAGPRQPNMPPFVGLLFVSSVVDILFLYISSF